MCGTELAEGVSIFFFSSRRRHTRYWRDWSSDVCSSDLEIKMPKLRAANHLVPWRHPRHRGIHHDQLLGQVAITGRVGIGHHGSDVVADDDGLFDAERCENGPHVGSLGPFVVAIVGLAREAHTAKIG